ncbi:MAG: FIST N-terminal domain-containing protein [Phycisphaerales bacterium]
MEAAGAALAAQPGITPDHVLLFCTGRHNPAALRDGVRSVLGPTPKLVGGYSVGIIAHDGASYDGHEVGLALLETGGALTVHGERGLAGAEAAVGERLGTALHRAGITGDDGVILLYDTVHPGTDRPTLNMATPLLEGLARTLGAAPEIAGMGMLGDMQLQPTRQFLGDEVLDQSALALHLRSPALRLSTTILHGCRPAGRYHEITATDGPVVLTMDGRPALDVVAEMLGRDSGLTPEEYAFFVTLGVNTGDRFGPYREDDYANRMCIGVDEERRGLVMFENDLRPGMSVQLMRRALDFAYIGPRVRALLERAPGRPVLAFYIDCAGRAGAYCGLDAEEADEVRASIPREVPLLGVYSGVEIARLQGRPQALDWTGVLCLLTAAEP